MSQSQHWKYGVRIRFGAVLMNLVLDILKFCASQEPIYMNTSMNTFLATSNKNPLLKMAEMIKAIFCPQIGEI